MAWSLFQVLAELVTMRQASCDNVLNNELNFGNLGKICLLLQYKRAATEHDHSTKSEEIKKGGLDALLGSLQQAKKVNVLDKSRMDWGDFKSSDVKVCRHSIFLRCCMFVAPPAACLLDTMQGAPHSPAEMVVIFMLPGLAQMCACLREACMLGQ